ncbi:hybrid sensor histidine kinase/response regulator [Thalassotalea sediminis]|uniref:hybrid sensor histidine kinase/response regulator n=1 Tax=Thalassotalea sediminis TaxID=1759089 RepID=UPI00257411D9|nr:ATP-binding protein [Thalassotalea sediminis]
MSRPLTAKYYIGLIAAALFIAIFITVIVFYQSTITVNKANEHWKQSHQSIYQQNQIIKDIYATIGYGGFIHHFKNYLLRHDEQYFLSAEQKIKHAFDLLAQYQSLSTNERERIALEALQDTLGQYQMNLLFLQELITRQIPIKEMDDLVRISDDDAIEALNSLTQVLLKKQQTNNSVLQQSTNTTTSTIKIFGYFVLSLLLIIAISMVCFFYFKLLKPLDEITHELAHANQKPPLSFAHITDKQSNIAELQQLLIALSRYIYQEHNAQQSLTQLQQQLIKSESFLKAILANAADSIIITDKAGNIITFNNSACRDFGYNMLDIIGSNFHVLLASAENQNNTYLTIDDSLINRISDKRIQLLAQRKNDSYFPAEVAVNSIKFEHSVFYCAIIRDLTKDKLKESQLNLLVKEARKTAQTKSEFVAAVSHEFRTPLNAILGFSQLSLERSAPALDSVHKQHFLEVIKASRHLLRLINNILDISKIESGKGSLSLSAVNAEQWLKDCIDLISPLAQKKSINVIANYTSNLPSLYIDKDKSQQALLNLLSNAVKYSPENSTVSISSKIINDKFLRLTVTDKGDGIKAADNKRIFQQFERLTPESTNIEGTGLGLYLTKQLIELQNGRVGFHSVWQKGSSFWIELPLHNEVENNKQINNALIEQSTARSEFSQDSEHLAHQFTILHIEDNLSNLHLIISFFKQYPNVTLASAYNGKDGIKKANTLLPDLILIDINLPDITGIEVANVLRQQPATKDTPIIAISANIQQKKKTEQLFKAFIEKPIAFDLLKTALKTHLFDYHAKDSQ